MRAFNIKYVVALEPELKSKLDHQLFKEEYESGPFTIYSLRDYEPGWAMIPGDADARIKTRIVDDGHWQIRVDGAKPGSLLVLKTSYHPYWRATVDGEPVGVESARYGLLGVRLEESSVVVQAWFDPHAYLSYSS